MAPPFHFPHNPKAFPQDIRRAQYVNGHLIMVTVVVGAVMVGVIILNMLTMPIGPEKEQGFAVAREVMAKVGFSIYLVTNTVALFSSVVGLVLLQIMAMVNISPSCKKRVTRMCEIGAQIAIGCAVIASVSAAMTFF